MFSGIKSYLLKNRLRFVFVLLLTILFFAYLKTYMVVPNEITLIKGQEHIYNFKSPFTVSIKADKTDMLKLNDGIIEANGSYLNLSGPIKLESSKKGSVVLDLKILGLIPLRTLKVDIVENRKIIPCGNTIGVRIRLDGILVVGVSDIKNSSGFRSYPARDAGIRAGDMIVKVNNKRIYSVKNLVKIIEKSQGQMLKIRFVRGSIYQDIEITPVRSADDGRYHLGLWVRDNTAGIGTLTFYDPETKNFAALGHGITDIDTGVLMPVNEGEILDSCILDITKGKQGVPGELKGVFVENSSILGSIKTNCEYGIYGILDRDALETLSKKEYPIGVKSQAVNGPAEIMANIKGKEINMYKVEIIRINRQSYSGSKGMVLRITDKGLLDSTGGIVQGMSGSPIIQNGRVIGAVTHVMVNDPSRGYGIFIETMIKNMDKNQHIRLLDTG